MASGFLQISTYSQTVAQPVGEALVTVFESGNPDRIIEELTTDGSGQSVNIELPAPPPEYSQAPNQPQPYSLYDVSVMARGYDNAQVTGVQVLPGERALQDVILFPGPVAEKEVIAIPANTLYGDYPEKIPESDIKDLPPASGFVVLPKPVIPEYMVVHAGRPTDAAPDYWVPFKDYVKVICC